MVCDARFARRAEGSLKYAAEAAARGDDVVGMMSLETIGYYTDVPGSQHYPLPFRLLLPDRGNFLAMVSNLGSVRALRAASRAFRSATRLPLLAAPAPAWIPVSPGPITGRSGNTGVAQSC